MHQLVAAGGELGIWIRSPGASSISPFVRRSIPDWLGSVSVGFDHSEDVVFSREGTLHPLPVGEGSSDGFEYLPTQDHGRDLSSGE